MPAARPPPHPGWAKGPQGARGGPVSHSLSWGLASDLLRAVDLGLWLLPGHGHGSVETVKPRASETGARNDPLNDQLQEYGREVRSNWDGLVNGPASRMAHQQS
jgi:hypothetical protein